MVNTPNAGTSLITGIGGQDGHYLSRVLVGQGRRVVGLTRGRGPEPAERPDGCGPGIEIRSADLLDLPSLIGVLDEVGPDEVYNLAGDSFVPSCWSRPLAAGQINGLALVHLLEAVRVVNPKIRVFQASSSGMYSGARTRRIDEESPLSPRDPYGASKALAHCAASSYRDAYGLFVCCGVLFNHESPRRGVQYVTRKISRAAARISLGLESVVHLGNLEAGRDWGYAGDFVDAMWKMLRADEPSDYVIGTGAVHTVADFAEAAFSRLGLRWREHVRRAPGLVRPGEGPPLVADSSKALRTLGWRAETSFEALVAKMVDADLALSRHDGGAASRGGGCG